MSDNPNSEDTVRLGIDVDRTGTAEWQAEMNKIRQSVDDAMTEIALDYAKGNKAAVEFGNALAELNAATGKAGTDAKALDKQLQELTADYDKLSKAATAAAESVKSSPPPNLPEQGYLNGLPQMSNQSQVGEWDKQWGVAAWDAKWPALKGVPPGKPPSPGEEGGEDDKPLGSMFGIGHALSVAGHATGSPILRDAGAFIYIEEGMRRVGAVMEQLGERAESAGGVLPLVTEGLAGMGLSVGSMAAAAVVAVPAIVGVALAIKSYNDMLDEQKKHVQEALQQLDAYYKAVESGTTEQIERDVNRLEHHKRTVDTEQAQLIDARTNAATGSPEAVKTLAVLTGVYGDIDKKIQELGADSTKTQAQIDGMKGALGSASVVTNDNAEAIRKNAATLIETSERRAGYDKLSSKAAQDRIDQLQREGANAEGAANMIEQHNNQLALSPAQYEANKEAIDKYREAATKARADIDYLRDSVIPAAQAAEYLAESAKNLKKSLEDAAKEAAAQASRIGDAIAGFHKAQSDGQAQLANQTENARLREGQAEEQYHKGSIQDIYERTRISLDEDRKELEARQQTADKIQDVTLKLYEKQYDIGLDYARQVQDDQTKLNNNLGKLAREGQYQQQEDQIDHQAKMAQLRERDVVADTQNLLDRNFKALYLAGLHKDQEARKEETDFAAKEAQQQRHRQQAATEAVISAQQERQQQQVAYLRKTEDAQRQSANEIVQADIAEQRKIQALRLAEHQKLSDLTTSENFKIQVLRHNLDNEIILYKQQERQRIEIARHTMEVIIGDALKLIAKIPQQNNAVNFGLGLLGGSAGALKNILFKDDGGSFPGGVPFMKGPISEGFDFGGGRGFALGGGSALVFPLQGGTATPQGGSSHKNITLAPTFNIYEATDIRRIKGELLDMLDEVQN